MSTGTNLYVLVWCRRRWVVSREPWVEMEMRVRGEGGGAVGGARGSHERAQQAINLRVQLGKAGHCGISAVLPDIRLAEEELCPKVGQLHRPGVIDTEGLDSAQRNCAASGFLGQRWTAYVRGDGRGEGGGREREPGSGG